MSENHAEINLTTVVGMLLSTNTPIFHCTGQTNLTKADVLTFVNEISSEYILIGSFKCVNTVSICTFVLLRFSRIQEVWYPSTQRNPFFHNKGPHLPEGPAEELIYEENGFQCQHFKPLHLGKADSQLNQVPRRCRGPRKGSSGVPGEGAAGWGQS